MIPPSCRVVRDGTLSSIPASGLVKGDVVLVVLIISYHLAPDILT
jgi:magnesium-transporting ATPase (P-type)